MALTYLGGDRIQGLSTDTKPTNVPTFTRFEETDTAKIYHYYSDIGRWIPLNDMPSAGWVELGRASAASNVINVTGLANKRYLMLLSYTATSGANNVGMQFNADTGNNYSGRYSASGGADATEVSQTNIAINDQDTHPQFQVGYLSNYSLKEKLYYGHSVDRQATGAGNAPVRSERIGKWANTNNVISEIKLIGRTGNITEDELVVLGYDPSDTHTTGFWQPLFTPVTLGVDGDTLSSGTFTPKKYMWIQGYIKGTSGADARFRVGNTTLDSNTNYSVRYSSDGGADATEVSISGSENRTVATPVFYNIFIINISSKEKLMMMHTCRQSTAGAANAPSRFESVIKWANTTSQIDIVGFVNVAASNDLSAGSVLYGWGHD